MSRHGSIDWLCLPRFDSPSVFAALVGGDDAGRWLLAPEGATEPVERSYLEGTFVLRTRWKTADGEAEVIEFMPHGDGRSDLVRRVRGISGSMLFRQVLRLRFDYGSAMPWVRKRPEASGAALTATAGPTSVILRGPRMDAADHVHTGTFSVADGEQVDLVLTHFSSHLSPPDPMDVDSALADTTRWWQGWAARSEPPSPYSDAVRRSLLVLRALTHDETGGIVAAATTSLPEDAGGTRNWDYRYVWLRDAALTIEVLVSHGYRDEAEEWRRWLLRAIAGDPGDVQIMYGIAGERRLPEFELEHLTGYAGSRPVRVGNAAYRQIQWDIFGEVMIALHAARKAGLPESEFSWPLQCALLSFLEENWRRPDHGIWEIRGPERHFTHSRAMVWAAFDRAAQAVREFGLPGDLERWESVRDEVRAEILDKGVDPRRGILTQYYGGSTVDGALLQLPQIGFLAPDDPLMLRTVAAIEHDLMHGGLLLRYRTETGIDGLPGSEHPFLACSFWLVEQYAASGRVADAELLMARLVGLANDVGLLSEEYDTDAGRQMGNVPQALSHLTLVRAADAITHAHSRATEGAPEVR